jgi:hypothetical protein
MGEGVGKALEGRRILSGANSSCTGRPIGVILKEMRDREERIAMKKIFQAATSIAQTLLAAKTEPLPVGAVAPNFTAASTRGDIELAPLLLKGPVVLALYYADFTPG